MDLVQGRQKERGRYEKRTSETFCTAEERVTSPHAKHRRRPVAVTKIKIKGKEIKERSLDQSSPGAPCIKEGHGMGTRGEDTS